ncbi:MAG: hypothetical protein HZA18_06780 [Nitrospirae bacterium]|nr:hypothetical protein [Nitrospirota bacterium]
MAHIKVMRKTSAVLYSVLFLLTLLNTAHKVFGAEYHGLVSLEDYYTDDSSSAYDFNLLSTRIRLDANKFNKAGSLSFHFEGRERNNLGSKDYNRHSNNERIDTLNLEYTGVEGYYFAAGRLWPKELYVERVDGVNLILQGEKLGIGIFGGTKPDPYTGKLNSDFTTVGGYIFYRKEELFANLAYIYSGYKGRTDREYIYGQSSFFPLKQIRLYGSLTVDINQFEEKSDLTNVMVELSYRPDYRKGLTFGYNQFRAYQLYRSMDFEIETSRQQSYYVQGDYRFRERYTLYGRYDLQSLHYNALEKKLRSSSTYQIGFRNDNLLNQHISMDMSATLADSYSSNSNTYNVQFSRFFDDVFQVTLHSSYITGAYDIADYTDNITTYDVSGYWTLSRRWTLSLSYEGRQAKDYYTNTILSRISWSF